MKESLDNKSLIKYNDNIFHKIRNLFLKLFGYKSKNTENIQADNTSIPVNESKSAFLESVKISENSDTNIFDLQRKYENGDLKVSDMSKEEYSKMEELYNKQIEILTNQIKYKKAKLSTN